MHAQVGLNPWFIILCFALYTSSEVDSDAALQTGQKCHGANIIKEYLLLKFQSKSQVFTKF